MLKTLSSRLFSDDLPRSRVLTLMLVAVLGYVLTAPFLFPGARSLNVAATICIFLVLVASFDLLLGYCGIVSFAHAMFYGIGAYGVAIALDKLDPSWGAMALGGLAAVVVAAVARGAAGGRSMWALPWSPPGGSSCVRRSRGVAGGVRSRGCRRSRASPLRGRSA